MKAKLIESSQAPRPGKKATTKAADQSRKIVEQLRPGTVAQIELSDGESVKGVKVSITRAAKALGRPVTLWDDGQCVYAELRPES